MRGRSQAQSPNGEIDGSAAFIALGENTFRLLAFSPARKFDGYDSAFQETIASIAKLTDRMALATQPDRISIVRTSRDMTLTVFDSQVPSVIDIEQLALINQLSGPDATIPAGTPVKRVVRGAVNGCAIVQDLTGRPNRCTGYSFAFPQQGEIMTLTLTP